MQDIYPRIILNTFITAVFFLITFMIISSVSAGEYPRTFVAWKGSTPVLDGFISPGEWEDAEYQTGVTDWNGNDGPAIVSEDLSLKFWMKHDGENFYIAFDVNDNILYGIDTERFLPDEKYNQPAPHELTQNGWPWYGDGIEVMIHAANTWGDNDKRPGDGSAWQMVCSSHKSRLYGLEAGGLLEGEPRASDYAWNNYQQWILDGDMEAIIRIKSHEEGRGYVIEWMVRPDPCLETTPGSFWDPANGVAEMGLTFEIQDLDTFEDGDSWGNIHHILLWASSRNKSFLKNYGTLRIEPGPMPVLDVADASPEHFTLNQNHPNPFNPSTRLSYTVPDESHVSLSVFNLLGQRVVTLIDGNLSAGRYATNWNGVDNFGERVSSGVYIVRLKAGNNVETRKISLVY